MIHCREINLITFMKKLKRKANISKIKFWFDYINFIHTIQDSRKAIAEGKAKRYRYTREKGFEEIK